MIVGVTNMKKTFLKLVVAALFLYASGCSTLLKQGESTTVLNLQLAPNKVKSVSVVLGQSTMDVIKQCEPAKFYCDDDPYLAYSAPSNQVYVLYFAPGHSKGKHDPHSDTLSGVALFPSNQGNDGVFLLPTHKRGQKCPKKYLEVKAILETKQNEGSPNR